jgi:secondary thiamine-phosphate synthase enzyme
LFITDDEEAPGMGLFYLVFFSASLRLCVSASLRLCGKMSFMKTIKVQSNEREEMIEITSEVERLLPEKDDGVCVLFTQHTTCGLTINENADPDVKHDMLLFLRNTIPQFYEGFRHFEHNSDAHIKSSLVGSSVTVPFENGKLLLGRWQGIYLCEFDGARERKVLLKII